VIRFSKWGVFAAALAALVAFLDNLAKFLGMFSPLPVPDWAVVLSQYKLEFSTMIIFLALAVTVNFKLVLERYSVYRNLLVGMKLQYRRISLYLEEAIWLLCLFAMVASFLIFEARKARTLYTAYGFSYLVKARCDGHFSAAHERSSALARNYFWSKYSDVLRNLEDRYGYLDAITPDRERVFGSYKDKLPAEVLQSDLYELRVLFGANPGISARAQAPKDAPQDSLTRIWLGPAPCKNL
jgi:hypothetical protein